jgi:signal transduction histidine kinase
LLEALEDLGSFSYSVAHDLRSPLKNIAALSEMLHASTVSTAPGSECVEFAERINRGAGRMIQLVDDLLRFSQTNTRQLELKQVALAPLVNEAIADIVPEERRGQVTLEIAPGSQVTTDAPLLKVVLHNLLSNALKFSRHVNDPQIVIGHDGDPERDHIWVKDNGVGFDPKHKDQAFGVFKRLHQPEQFEGTGVGLAIVQRVVSKHGGKVYAESAPGRGTTIHLELPVSHKLSAGLPFEKVA